MLTRLLPVMLVLILAPLDSALAQAPPIDESMLNTFEWRCIGPSRGGRSVAVAGVIGDRRTYYMGATGGGVWKTTDAGATWASISDEAFGTGSVGAITVAPSDPNVIYVGMGECCVRGNLSHGDGVYKSVDAGKTWTRAGLETTRHIGRIVVHPNNPDLVYVAALGHVYGTNNDRGVYRSKDGGASWKNIKFVSERAGAVDLAMDPSNPRVLYAAFWEVQRSPWSLDSGGEGSGLYKSTDSGETWEELTKGLPKGVKGRIGVTVSPVNPDRVWAIVEAEDGGVFRSDNGGKSWRRTNEDRSLRQRAWYYTHIYADTQEENTVYVLNVRFHKSTDGGKTFDQTIRVPHGDNHDLWIDPYDNKRMVNANDGGANVSFDGGASWSRQDNQPTAQFYHVITDTGFPYRVYGAQQDNSTVSISSRNRLGRDDFYSVGGGESGYIAPRHDNPDIVFAGSYGGYLTRYDHDTGKTRNIMVWPESPMGWGAEALTHRFQWTFPIVVSVHDPDTVYVGAERVFRTTDGGQSWTPISDDLSTNDRSKQGPSGGPITHDNTSVEYYCTVFTIAESPLNENVIWAGTDDGLVHITQDGGRTWRNVTPRGMGEWPLISLIEASPHDANTAYAAVNRYKQNDFTPMIYRTTDAGRTWSRISDGIDDGAFVRAVREDPARKGMLYAGTETGVWLSMTDGASWQPLQLNLPRTPITDLVVQGDDLVVATQGRSFWILDDISALRSIEAGATINEPRLFAPSVTYRQGWDRVGVRYALADETEDDVTIEFLGRGGDVVRSFTTATEKSEGRGDASSEDDDDEGEGGGWGRAGGQRERPSRDAGMNHFEWNMRYPDAVEVPKAVMWGGSVRGPMAAPGEYRVRLTVGDTTMEQAFTIAPDPRVETTPAQYAEQIALLLEIRDALSSAHETVNAIRSIRSQVNATIEQSEGLGGSESIREAGKSLVNRLEEVEEELIQTRSKAPQDPLNYPVKLNNKLATLAGIVESDFPVTEACKKVFTDLSRSLDAALGQYRAIVETDVPTFNRLVQDQAVPAVILDRNDEE